MFAFRTKHWLKIRSVGGMSAAVVLLVVSAAAGYWLYSRVQVQHALLLNWSMVPLYLLAVWGIAAIGQLVFELLPERLMPGRLVELTDSYEAGNPVELGVLKRRLDESPGLLASVLHSLFVRESAGDTAQSNEERLSEALAREFIQLHRHVVTLDFIVQASMMAGLLATTLGLFHSFSTAAVLQGAARHEAMTKGVGEAIVGTMGGLMIALICATVANRLSGVIENQERRLFEKFRKLIDAVAASRHKQLSQPSENQLGLRVAE